MRSLSLAVIRKRSKTAEHTLVVELRVIILFIGEIIDHIVVAKP